MTDFEKRLWKSWNSKKQRTEANRLDSKNELDLACSVLLLALVSFSAGVLNADVASTVLDLDVNSVDSPGLTASSDVVWSGGQRFVFQDPERVSDMEGNWGYVNSRDVGRGRGMGPVFLSSDLKSDFDQLWRTCVHERLHLSGLGESEHPRIEELEDEVVDEACLGLLYLLDGS